MPIGETIYQPLFDKIAEVRRDKLALIADPKIKEIIKGVLDKGFVTNENSGIDAVEAQNIDPLKMLCAAAANGCLDVVKYLVEQKHIHAASFTSSANDEKGLRPLQLAAFGGHLDIVKYLATKEKKLGLNIGIFNENQRASVVTNLAKNDNGNHGSSGSALAKNDKNYYLRNHGSSGSAPIYYAAMNGHLDVVNILIKEGVSRESLEVAALNGRLDVLRSICSNIVLSDFSDQDWSNLSKSVQNNGHKEVAKYIITKGYEKDNAAKKESDKNNPNPTNEPRAAAEKVSKNNYERIKSFD